MSNLVNLCGRRREVAERILAYTVRSGFCLVWRRDTRKLPSIKDWNGDKRNVHAIAYRLWVDPELPFGVRVARTCGNRLCVEPSHLSLDPQYLPKTSWCECGNEKKRSRQVCDRCADLDGPINSIDVMNELRASDGGATIYEIAAGTGRSTRSVVRTLRGWLKEGRVLRLMGGEAGDERGGCEAAVWRLA